MKSPLKYKDLTIQIGEQIEQTRLLKKRSIKEMASSLDLTDTSYRNIERGITEITIIKLFQIANTLNVPFIELLPADAQIINSDKTQNAHIDAYNSTIEAYKSCIAQYKEEVNFLKHEIHLLHQIEGLRKNVQG